MGNRHYQSTSDTFYQNKRYSYRMLAYMSYNSYHTKIHKHYLNSYNSHWNKYYMKYQQYNQGILFGNHNRYQLIDTLFVSMMCSLQKLYRRYNKLYYKLISIAQEQILSQGSTHFNKFGSQLSLCKLSNSEYSSYRYLQGFKDTQIDGSSYSLFGFLNKLNILNRSCFSIMNHWLGKNHYCRLRN